MIDIKIIGHPLVADRLTHLRDIKTDQKKFRLLLDEISQYLVYEAMREHKVRKITVNTPVGLADGLLLDSSHIPLVVPVLRAGLGMLDGALRVLPDAKVGFVGLSRDEETFLPVPYFTNLPCKLRGDTVLVLDPMIATGGSLAYTCEFLAKNGAGKILVVCVVASPEGLLRLETSDLDIKIVTASIDDGLNDKAYVIPGLGDAGDRLYGNNEPIVFE